MRFSSLALLVYLSLLPGLARAQEDGEIAALRRKLAEQERQIEALRTQLSEQRALLDRLSAKADSTQPAQPVAAARTNPAPAAPAPAKAEAPAHSAPPLGFELGGVHFKPGGFLDLGFVTRTKNVGSGVPTAFGAIPFGDSVQGQLSDVRFTAQNSRVSLSGDGAFGSIRFRAYMETDFLGQAPANLAVTSNSGTLRMRQYWARVSGRRWEILGGQAWSLLTPNRRGVEPDPSDVFTTLNEDPNYMVGLVWGRDPQFRLVLRPSRTVTTAIALEAAEQYSAGVVALPAALQSSYSGQINSGAGALTAPTVMPDIIWKTAYDRPAGGRELHLEMAGLARAFRVYNPVHTQHYVAPGYGGSFNGNYELVKNLRLLLNTFFSHGGGRYIFGLGPDVIARADGSLSPVGSAAGIAGLEWTRPVRGSQHNGSSTFFAYYGRTYFQRNEARDLDGAWIGFGFPGSSTSANRSIEQYSLGLSQTAWKSVDYGALRFITQYSYITRSPWYLEPARPRNAPVNMVQVGMRYELP